MYSLRGRIPQDIAPEGFGSPAAGACSMVQHNYFLVPFKNYGVIHAKYCNSYHVPPISHARACLGLHRTSIGTMYT